VPLKIDVSKNTDHDEELQKRYDSETLPSVVFLTPDSTVVGRVRQMMEPEPFLEVLKPAVLQLRAGGPLAANTKCD